MRACTQAYARAHAMVPTASLLRPHTRTHVCSRRAGSKGNTALHMASANGHVACMELLLKSGAAAGTANRAGNTPLHWAVENGQEAAVRFVCVCVGVC